MAEASTVCPITYIENICRKHNVHYIADFLMLPEDKYVVGEEDDEGEESEREGEEPK
jgi:hypothetical protein